MKKGNRDQEGRSEEKKEEKKKETHFCLYFMYVQNDNVKIWVGTLTFDIMTSQ